MTLEKIKKLVDEMKISELLERFYCVEFLDDGVIKMQGHIKKVNLDGYKEWKYHVNADDDVMYKMNYENIEITLHK